MTQREIQLARERDIWRNRAIESSAKVRRISEASVLHHQKAEEMADVAEESIRMLEVMTRVFTAIMNGDTAIGGAQ